MSKTRIQGLDEDEIRFQLNRILESDIFFQSQRQCSFLQYITEQTIAGNSDRLKGYTLGIEVFERDESFDPGVDSIVRVEAGRLRSKLREYYQTVGSKDAIVIELPKGNYSPVFRKVDADEPATSTGVELTVTPASLNFPENAIAVLPLRPLSGDIDHEYFCDGMTDAIINTLAKNKSLKVISLTSVLSYKKKSKTLKQIAGELNVSHILEGTVLKEGNDIRLSAQLIETRTDYHLWAECFERELSGILVLQRELAELIATALTQEIYQAPDSKADNIINPEAYEAFLLGRRKRSEFTRESFYKAADYFKQAVKLEPEYSAAWSGLASCYCGLGSHGFELECPTENIPQGLEYARQAMNLDNSSVDPHTYTGIMKLKYEWDWPGAEECFKKALDISPSDSRAHLQYSMYFESLGDHENAINEALLAHNVDPLSKEVNMNLAWQYYQADNITEAEIRLDRLLEYEPDFWGAYWDLGHLHLASGEYDFAIEAFKKSDAVTGGYFMPLQGLGYAYAKAGRKDDAKKVIKKLEKINSDSYVSPYYFATIYLGLGDIDKTYEYLEEAFKVRSRSLAWINVAKEYLPLRTDSQFKDLIKRIGIPA